jgi:hypothetical protein
LSFYRLDRRRALISFGGAVLRTLFGTATISDINSRHNFRDELQQRNSDRVHSLFHQVTYLKKLGATAEINANDLANLSNIIKQNTIQSHDKIQQITRDVMWLNLTLHGQGELHTVVRVYLIAVSSANS